MWDHNTMLQQALLVHDRLFMAAGQLSNSSVETRIPWLDHRIIELAAQIPYAKLIFDGREKYPVRALAKKLSHLPVEVINRDKSALPHTPVEYEMQIAELMNITASQFRESPFMNSLFRKEALKYIDEHTDDPTIQSQLSKFYLIYQFGKLYFDQ